MKTLQNIQKNKLSVIIPVHNGENFLKKTVNGILKQSYKNLELILVENASQDNSLLLCKNLSEKGSRVIVLQCKDRGTSLARKAGILAAKGKYIVFSDQDDAYISKNSLEKMVRAIEEDNVQICQFGYYKRYIGGIKRNIRGTKKILSRDELMRNEIKGVIGDPSSIYNTNVWSKIYDTRVLKSAVENISETLYYAEDVCLNMWAFFDNLTRRVSARGESYYIWNVGIEFSSSRGAENTLFSEYKYIKPLTVKLLKSVNCPSSAFKQCYMESIYFQKAIIQNMIRDKIDMKSCIQKIEEMMQCDFIIEAKAYIATNFKDKSWEELKFLTSEYTADEYYYYCLNHMPQNTLKYSIGKLLNILKKL